MLATPPAVSDGCRFAAGLKGARQHCIILTGLHEGAGADEAGETAIFRTIVVAQKDDAELGPFARNLVTRQPAAFIRQIDIQQQRHRSFRTSQNSCPGRTIRRDSFPADFCQLPAEQGRVARIAVADDHARGPMFG